MSEGIAGDTTAAPQLDLEVDPAHVRPGVRLQRVEIYNWGTFDKQIWCLDLGGDNALLTGDIGSGKSTLVDAITSLLVPAHRIAFNKAAGAGSGERDLRSYVLGHYKSERGEAGLSAKPVALRHHNSYSVILGRFRHEGFGETVTLAQVFWFREAHGQPARFYLVADRALSVQEHFSGFGRDINSLRKRLRKLSHVELFESFKPYGAAFRRRFGIDTEQALDLFHQTVSMKAVGDLTDFVRTHMLEPFPVDDRIQHMIAHFEDLTRAHGAVVKARAQIERLAPIVGDCKAHAEVAAQVEDLRASREALRAFFAGHKIALLDKRISGLSTDIARLDERIAALRETRRGQDVDRDALKQAILENGGDRIAQLGREIEAKAGVRQERQRRAESYGRIAGSLGFAEPRDADAFLANGSAIAGEIETVRAREADIQNKEVEIGIEFRTHNEQHNEVSDEIASLKSRRSNIPARMLAIRERMCSALKLDADDLPFAGELIEVRQEERDWEGAAERLLHGFALSLLVPDTHYSAVAGWVDATHLGGRLVYYRVQNRPVSVRARRDPRAMANKLAIKDDSIFYDWLQRQIDERYDHSCCAGLDEFRREDKAITRTGQIKQGGLARFPGLRDWLARKPLAALGHADDWERILDCLAWFRAHPRSGLYARQIDVVGVHTKFIEVRKGLLAELLDIVLPSEAIDPSPAGARGFEARYGLRTKPSLVRFRILDDRHAIAGLTDLTVPAGQFVGMSPGIARVFVVENEITGLAFPPMPDCMVVLGLGHAVTLLAAARWLADRDLHYWSDLDTHGFAMLDRLRASLPRVRSLLMDRATLLAHRPLWTAEEAPHVAPLDRLTAEEAALYADLRYDRLGRSVRLEQERISFGWLRSVLDALDGADFCYRVRGL